MRYTADRPPVAPERSAAAGSGTTLIVPGYRGSEPGHWQSWMEGQLVGARRVSGIDWDAPVLSAWVAAVRRDISAAAQPVWLVAHSFGCLAAVLAGSERPERIAGALLVAPADPDRFSPAGLRTPAGPAGAAPLSAVSLTPLLPNAALGFATLVVASRNDPWMPVGRLRAWATIWGSRFTCIGRAGHINVDSGFGPWPEGLALLRTLQTTRGDRLPGALRPRVRGRVSSP